MRASWDEYFLDIAIRAASRATCTRKHVGAVVAVDKSIVATGYNGAMAGLEHCEDVGCMMEDGHCVRTIHAEVNAIVQAARRGHAVRGGTMYVTALPCWRCFQTLVNAGIKRVVYFESYRPDGRVIDAAAILGISLDQLTLAEKGEAAQ